MGGEEDGVHYNFTNVEQMREEIAQGKFIEHAEVFGKFYGTSFDAVAKVQKSGRICLLDIDIQGAQQMKTSALDKDACYLFIMPPDPEALGQRLRNRGREEEEEIKVRLQGAEREMAFARDDPMFFNNILVNDDLEKTYKAFRESIGSLCG